MASTRLVVGAAIVDSLHNPTQLLAAQRSYPPGLDGLWEFPGGKVEDGETPEAAIHREIHEELGAAIVLGARIASPSASGDWPLPGGNSYMRLWLAQIDPQGPHARAGSSHRQIRWIDADAAAALPWLPGDLQSLPSLAKALQRCP